MIIRTISFCLLLILLLGTSVSNTGCSRENDAGGDTVYVDPLPFPTLAEDNTGSRARSITYVYDRRTLDPSYPPKVDSSIILMAYNSAGKLSRLRLTQDDFYVYDFTFERNASNKLVAIHCNDWAIRVNPAVTKSDMVFDFNGAGIVTRMRSSYQNDPYHLIDTFLINYNGSRIDTVTDRGLSSIFSTVKYAFNYNGAGDITRVIKIRFTGIFFVYEELYQYTLSASPAPLVAGDDALLWYFMAHHVTVSGSTDFLVPPVFFHSAKQPSGLVVQNTGQYTSNYQTEYYGTGRPKKMTANVTDHTGAFYAREAYYYTYAQ